MAFEEVCLLAVELLRSGGVLMVVQLDDGEDRPDQTGQVV